MSDDRGLDPNVTGSAVRLDPPADAPLSVEQAGWTEPTRQEHHLNGTWWRFNAGVDNPARAWVPDSVEQAIAAAAVTRFKARRDMLHDALMAIEALASDELPLSEIGGIALGIAGDVLTEYGAAGSGSTP